MAHILNSKNSTAKKEKSKPSNITISTGSQVFITLGAYNNLNTGLQTATVKNNNGDTSLHFIDTKKKTPTNNPQSLNNYFANQKQTRAVSGSSSNNPGFKNFFNQKIPTSDIQAQIKAQPKRIFSPSNIIQAPGDIQLAQTTVASTINQANKAQDVLNVSNNSVQNKRKPSGSQQKNPGGTKIKLQKSSQVVDKTQKKIQKVTLVNESSQYQQMFSQHNNKQQSINENDGQIGIMQLQNQFFHHNDSTFCHYDGNRSHKGHSFQNCNNQGGQQQIMMTQDYSTRNDGTDGKVNTSGNGNQSFQNGIAQFGQPVYQGSAMQGRGGSSGSANNKTKTRVKSNSNKASMVKHHEDQGTFKKKITINTNPALVLLEQQNLNRGVHTSKTTNDNQSVHFQNMPITHDLKQAITPGVIKTNLVKKGLIIQTSQNLQTKKQSTQKSIVNTGASVKQIEDQKSQPPRKGEINPNFKLLNNNIFYDNFNIVQERELQTAKNMTNNLKDNQKIKLNGKKFNLDHAAVTSHATSSDKNQSIKGHSNILKMFKQQQDQKIVFNTNPLQQQTEFDQNSVSRSQEQGNTSFNGPYTVKGFNGGFNNLIDLKINQQLRQLNSNNASQKKYKTIAEEVVELNNSKQKDQNQVMAEEFAQNGITNILQQAQSKQKSKLLMQGVKSSHKKQITDQKANDQKYRTNKSNQILDQKEKQINDLMQNFAVGDFRLINDANNIKTLQSKTKLQSQKCSNVKRQSSHIKTSERTGQLLQPTGVILNEGYLKESKSNQPNSKMIEKLKIGFQQMLQPKDQCQALHDNQFNILNNLIVKDPNIGDHANNMSCEITDLKSLGSARSRVSKTGKQLQLNLKNENNYFQMMKKATQTNKSTKQNNAKAFRFKDKDSLSPQLREHILYLNKTKSYVNNKSRTVKTSACPPTRNRASEKSLGKQKGTKIVSKQTFVAQELLGAAPSAEHQTFQPTNIPTHQGSSRLVSQYTLKSQNSSKASLYKKLKLRKLQTVQQSLPDLNMALNEKESFIYNENEDPMPQEECVIMPIQKKPSKVIATKKKAKIEQPHKETVQKVVPDNGVPVQFYEEELKKRDYLVQLLCQKIEGMESQITLLTKKQIKVGESSINDSKDNPRNNEASNTSPLNLSLRGSSSNQETSKDLVRLIKDLLQSSGLLDQSDPSIKKHNDASMSSQQTALLLRCMQMNSKQSKAGSMTDYHLDNLIDQEPTDIQLQHIMSLVNRTEEEVELEENSKYVVQAKHESTAHFKYNDPTLSQEQVLGEMLTSFEVPNQKNEILNQPISETSIADMKPKPQAQSNKIKLIEQGINSLQNKLNDFNNFNKNPKRIAELRKYCTTSITHTTKTISGGISSRLLKSGSNSGEQSKNKTTTRHYHSQSNLDQNSLITVGNGDMLNPNCLAFEFFKNSSASNNFKQIIPDDKINRKESPIKLPSLHEANLSNILGSSHIQPIALADNQYQKSNEEDEEIKELEGLMQGRMQSDEETKCIDSNTQFYQNLEREWQRQQNEADNSNELNNSKSTNSRYIKLSNSMNSDRKIQRNKVKMINTQKITMIPSIIEGKKQISINTNLLNNMTSSNEGSMPQSNKSRQFNMDRSQPMKADSRLKNTDGGQNSFISWNNEDNFFYKTRTESDKARSKKQNNLKQGNSLQDESAFEIDKSEIIKSSSKSRVKVKVHTEQPETLNNSHRAADSSKNSNEIRQKIKILTKLNLNEIKQKVSATSTNKNPQMSNQRIYFKPNQKNQRILSPVQEQSQRGVAIPNSEEKAANIQGGQVPDRILSQNHFQQMQIPLEQYLLETQMIIHQ